MNNVSFRRVACEINLPSDKERADPRLNGLVDRSYYYSLAQALNLYSERIPKERDPLAPRILLYCVGDSKHTLYNTLAIPGMDAGTVQKPAEKEVLDVLKSIKFN